MSKKSLLFFNRDSIKANDVKASNYVVANIGYFFQDVIDKRAEIMIEGELNISLPNSYIVVDEEKANEIIETKKSPNSTIMKLQEENSKLQEELSKLKNELNTKTAKK